MIIHYKFIGLLLLQSLIACASANAEPDSAYLQLITVTCYTCHSENSGKATAIPALDGLTAGEIKQLLTAYKTGQKQGTIMRRIAQALTDDDIEQVSEMLDKAGK